MGKALSHNDWEASESTRTAPFSAFYAAYRGWTTTSGTAPGMSLGSPERTHDLRGKRTGRTGFCRRIDGHLHQTKKLAAKRPSLEETLDLTHRLSDNGTVPRNGASLSSLIRSRSRAARSNSKASAASSISLSKRAMSSVWSGLRCTRLSISYNT